jgi:hypothetical protein
MSADRDPVEELLGSIADGTQPDWESAERALDPSQRPRVASLRDVSRIADFSRTHQRAGDPPATPERWGDLLLLERLSEGTVEVHRAWDPNLQREVALKLMRPGPGDAALLEEGRIAARIRHPHVVTIHGVDRHDDRVGLWMELVRGPTLEQEVRVRGPLSTAEARRLGVEIGSALAAVHAAGLLHRDVKPANVIRDSEGRFVLADFGLGVREAQAASTRDRPSGTPMYMAPELLAGGAASERSDLYSLGMSMWFALAGRHPFLVDTLADLVPASSTGPRPRLRELRPGVPAGLVAIVERAIEPEPGKRYAGLRPMIEALEAWRARPWEGAPIPWRVSLAVAVVVLACMVLFGPWREKREDAKGSVPVAGQPSPTVPAGSYAVEASFLRRDDRQSVRLVSGDRVKPGDRLSLEVRASRPAWVYVLNEDDRGERYLLFPQARFDAGNPLVPDSTFVLPGTVGDREQAWTVTSAGGREHFLVVVSPAPVPEIEADLDRFPAPTPGRTVDYPSVEDATLERLRGVGGTTELPRQAARPAASSRAFERFRSLAGRETGVQGIWVRQVVFENPRP